MQETTKILKDIELMFLQARLRLDMATPESVDPSNVEATNRVLAVQLELEAVHAQVIQMENSLLKKINQFLRVQLDELAKQKHGSK